MKSLTRYVEKFLKTSKESFLKSNKKDNYPYLSNDEKVIVYAYTNEHYETVNEKLRTSKGLELNDFARYLIKVLKKIPPYAQGNDFVYRGVFLTKNELNYYEQAFKNKTKIIEYHFLSTSKKKSIAKQVPNRNTLFKIISKTGKSVEEIAFHGAGDGQNEYEVLFTCCAEFMVLEITNMPDNTYEIIMEEI